MTMTPTFKTNQFAGSSTRYGDNYLMSNAKQSDLTFGVVI